jgi:hypothetical protein
MTLSLPTRWVPWGSDRVNSYLKHRGIPGLKIETWGTLTWYENTRSKMRGRCEPRAGLLDPDIMLVSPGIVQLDFPFNESFGGQN